MIASKKERFNLFIIAEIRILDTICETVLSKTVNQYAKRAAENSPSIYGWARRASEIVPSGRLKDEVDWHNRSELKPSRWDLKSRIS